MNPGGFGDGDFTLTNSGQGFTGPGSDDSNSGHGESNNGGQDILQNFPYLRQGLGQGLFSQPVSTSSSQQPTFTPFKSPFIQIENIIGKPVTLAYSTKLIPITRGQVPSISTFTTPLSELQKQIAQPYLSQMSSLSTVHSAVHTPAVSDVSHQPYYKSASTSSCHGTVLQTQSTGTNKAGVYTVNKETMDFKSIVSLSSVNTPIFAAVTPTTQTQSTGTLSSIASKTPALSSVNTGTPIFTAGTSTATVQTQSTRTLSSTVSYTPIFTTVKSEGNIDAIVNATISKLSPVVMNMNSSNCATNSAVGNVENMNIDTDNKNNLESSNADFDKVSIMCDMHTSIKQEITSDVTYNINNSNYKAIIEVNENNVTSTGKPTEVLPDSVRFVLKGSLHQEKNRYPLEVFTEPVDREEVFFDNLVYNLSSDLRKSSISDNSKNDISKRPSHEEDMARYTEPSIAEIRAGAVGARDKASNTDITLEDGEDSDARTDDYEAEESLTTDNPAVVTRDANMSESWYNEAMLRYAEVTKGEDFDDVEMSPSIKKGGRSDPENPFALTSPSFSESAAKALMTTTNSATATIVMISIMSIGSRKKLIPKIINSQAAAGGIVSIMNPIENMDNIEVKSETTPIMSKLRRDKKDEGIENDENDTEIDRLDINIKIDDDQYVSHGDHKRWQCKLCPKSYTTKHNLVAHILDHSSIKPHLCLVCGKYFKQLSHLNTHMLTHDNVKPHVCNVCNKGFTQISHLKRHETVHLPSKPYICDICNRGFAYPSELRIHKEKHIAGKEKCDECDLEFATAKELKDHMLFDKHCNDLTCRHCERIFKFPSQLRDHMMSHAGARPFICSECGMDFMKEHHLKAHQFTHTGLRPYMCPHCNRAFNQKANMMRHMLIHNAERAFKCTVCSKTFTQPQTLKAHMVVHAAKKPYSCKFCGKEFGRQHNLQGHLHIHSDSKPYVCSICQAAFTLKGNLNRHKKVKHGLNESTENMEEDAVNFLSALSGRANDSLLDTDQDFDSRDETTSPDFRSPKKGRKSVPKKHVNRNIFGNKIAPESQDDLDDDDDDDVGDDDEENEIISYSDEERENEARMKGERSKYFEASYKEDSISKSKNIHSVGNDIGDDIYGPNDKDTEIELDDGEVIKDENENGVRKVATGKGKKEEKVVEPERRSTRKRKRKAFMFEYDDGTGVGDDDDIVGIKEKKKTSKVNRKGAKLDNLIATKFKNL